MSFLVIVKVNISFLMIKNNTKIIMLRFILPILYLTLLLLFDAYRCRLQATEIILAICMSSTLCCDVTMFYMLFTIITGI